MGLIPLSDKNEESGTGRGLWDRFEEKVEILKSPAFADE